MSATRLSASRRREDIRAWWAEHLSAQRDSGQTQAAYCRTRGLDPKYFTLWKRKLLADSSIATPRLVPVTVKPSSVLPGPRPADESTTPAAVSLRLSLGNGLSVSLEIALAALPAVVRELAAVRC